MENLFMQVFERRDWVTAQMRQQVDSHAQSLACSLLAAGHRPPPWMLPSFAVEPQGPQELNGKPIISELLFPGRQITTPATNRTVFQPPAVPSTSFRNVGFLNGYTPVETVCPTLDTNQHEDPQLKQTSDNQELAGAVAEVNVFSVVQRSRSRQRSIEDRLREKDQAANSGRSDGMQARMQRSRLATVGSNRTTASLSPKPCGDGANNAGTTASLPGQENGFHANQGRSTESLKCSKDGDLGNQGVLLDSSQSLVQENQIVSFENNVKVPNNCSVRNLLGVQATDSVCHPLPETHLSVEPKKLQFDGVESVCMNPASEQTMQQHKSALESGHPDRAEARPLNEDRSSTSCSEAPCSMGRSLLHGVESGYLNPDSAPVKQQQKSALECASLDLTGMHSQKEDPSLTSSPEVPSSMSGPLLEKDTWCICAINSVEGPCSKVSPPHEKEKLNSDETNCFERSCSAVSQLLERDTLHIVEDTEKIRILDCSSDQIVTQNSKSLVKQCSDYHVLHPLYRRSLQVPTQLADTSSGAPASPGILPDSLLEEDGCEDLSCSLINDANSQSSPARFAACPKQLQPQTVISGDVYQPSLSSYNTQSDDTHSNGCPPVVNELLQEQYLLAKSSLKSNGNFTDVDTPLGHPPPGTKNETLNGHPAYDVINCHLGKLGDGQVKFSDLTEACDISVRNKKDESVVPEVMSSISAKRTSERLTTERNSMTSAEKCTRNLQQDGTEQDTSPFENAVQINANSCTAENDKRMKLSRPSVQYFLRSTASHEKINLLQSDRSSAACDQKRSVGDGVQVNACLSSKRRRIRCRSDVNLSRTPCANSLSLNHQVGIAGHMLTAANFSEKSQPSGRYFLRSSGSCESMSLESEGRNDASNRKMSVASDIYGNWNSSRGRQNTTGLSNVVRHSSRNASSSRSAIVERVFENSQKQIKNILEVEFLTTTAALPSCSGILSDNEANCTQEENTCLEGQDLNVTDASVADQEMALQMDNMSSRNVILHPDNYSGLESFTIVPGYAPDQHGEQASTPNALFQSYGSNAELGRKYKSYDPKGHLLSGAPISRQLSDESVDCDDSMPEFESFDVPVQFDSPTIGQSTFESLYDSRQLVTISSDPPKKCNINSVNGVDQLLTFEKSTNYSFRVALQQYSASNGRNIMDTFGAYGLGLDDSFFISDAVASCSSNASSRQEINETPLTPSVEKYSLGKLSSRSEPSSEHMGSIPELECFRIDEDSSIAEEDEYQDRLPGSVDANYSQQWPSGRKALQDITALCQNNGNSASLSTRCMDTGNVGLTAETFSSEFNYHSNIRNDHDINKPKDNHPISVKREGKVSHSLHDRLGRTEILDSRNGRHSSEANVDRRSKPTNIVANVTSFIPLLKPKLQPTTACVKKDVKVKALKAAEAAKRLEEKKQKEQEMRKAAARLERERLKQEKEQKQKLEEEQKKKRDADIATRKRQREEVERRETVRKRKCVDEARKQQKQPMDRRRNAKDEKDARRKASDNMELRNNLVDVGKSQVKADETTEPALGYKANKCNNEKGVVVDERTASFGSHAKENTPNSLEESYEMSPYKDSDAEDNDDFEHEQESTRRRKFIPSWARKENLDKILLSNKTLDPREIFAQKCSFSVSDVLSAHIPQRGFR